MHKTFIPLFLIACAGVIVNALVSVSATSNVELLKWTGLLVGLIPLFLYHGILLNSKQLGATKIDSVYYFGFLITVVTLVAAALAIGKSKSTPDLSSILMQFGLGLIATGYSLFARLHLLNKFHPDTGTDSLEATEKLSQAIERVADRMNEAGHQVEAVIAQAQLRIQGIEERVVTAEQNFQQKLDRAGLAFSEALAHTVESSIESSARILESATSGISAAVHSVSDEISRVRAEVKEINAKDLTRSIAQFSNEVQNSLRGITNSTATTSTEANNAISELTSASRKLQRLAQQVGAKASGLEGLEATMQAIGEATQAIALLATQAAASKESLARISPAANGVADSFEDLMKINLSASLGQQLSSVERDLSALSKGTAEAANSMLKLMTKLDSAEVVVQEKVIESDSIAKLDAATKDAISALQSLQSSLPRDAAGGINTRPLAG